jgi:hypothetical protein
VEVLTEDQLTRLKTQTPPLAEPSVGAIRRIGAFERLTATPLKEPAFSDTKIDLTRKETVTGDPIYDRKLNLEQIDPAGQPYRFTVYAYRVRAVNAAGAESGPSPPFFTIPTAPQSLFTREEGTSCDLTWRPNPEKDCWVTGCTAWTALRQRRHPASHA